jgi:predicted NBD/HSP70 family sugar kinase
MGGAEARSGSAAVDVLRRVHARPSITRAELARDLGLGSGSATEVAARLRQAQLLDETPAPPTGSRGRPTTCLGSHPLGPLVLAAEIEHDGWALSIVELGGTVVRSQHGSHRSHRPETVLRALTARIREARSAEPERLRAVGVSFAGAVQDDRLAQVHNLGWRDVDVRPILGEATENLPLVIGNDATLGGLAEARRGAATESATLLHLRVQAGIGGVVVDRGRPFLGSSGAAGEFGHLPFGDPARRCPCGARGCWSNEVDGGAIARALGHRAPRDTYAFGAQVMTSARQGDADALRAVRQVSSAFGVGIGGLVNALDPDAITVAGLGADFLEVAGKQLRSAYVSGLMTFHRADPPPILPARFGAEGPLVGAAEAAFDQVLTESAVEAWFAAHR